MERPSYGSERAWHHLKQLKKVTELAKINAGSQDLAARPQWSGGEGYLEIAFLISTPSVLVTLSLRNS